LLQCDCPGFLEGCASGRSADCSRSRTEAARRGAQLKFRVKAGIACAGDQGHERIADAVSRTHGIPAAIGGTVRRNSRDRDPGSLGAPLQLRGQGQRWLLAVSADNADRVRTSTAAAAATWSPLQATYR
jgi:hypothetical protein